MAQKIKKIILSFHRPFGNTVDAPYQVERIEHSTEFNPGEYLSKKIVDDLNMSRLWHVSIVRAK